MEYTTLGRTGLKVSVISLGTGGHSRIGQSTGRTEDDSIRIVREAVDHGMNLIDSSELYGTEELVGKAISTIPRDKLILSTKVGLYVDGTLKKGDQLIDSLDGSLKKLGTDYIDIYMLHAVTLEDYDYAVEELVPAMIQMRDAGKIGYLGITEGFASDPDHKALTKAVDDDIWDAIMVGFNILNQSAANYILKKTLEKDMGVMNMFAVRRALTGGEPLIQVINELIHKGLIDQNQIDRQNPLSFVMDEYGCRDLTEASYRFCRYQPGIDTVLSGTGNMDHLRQNVESILKGPLPDECVSRLRDIFKGVDSVSGN